MKRKKREASIQVNRTRAIVPGTLCELSDPILGFRMPRISGETEFWKRNGIWGVMAPGKVRRG